MASTEKVGYFLATTQIMNRDLYEQLLESNKVFAMSLLNKFIDYLKDSNEDEIARQGIFFTFLQIYEDSDQITNVVESIKDDKCSILFLPMYYEHVCNINDKLINKELKKHDCTHLVFDSCEEEEDQFPEITVEFMYIPNKE